MKRFLGLMLSVLLLVGMAIPAAASNIVSLPLTEEPVTYTYWVSMHSNAARVMSDLSENLAHQEIEKRTGVHIEFVHPVAGQETEQFNLMVAARDLTDFIENINMYPGGIGKMMADGLLLPLNDLVAEHAPNIQHLLDTYPEIKLQSRTNDGKMWGFAIWGMWEPERPISPWAGPGIRADWLEQLGLDMPVTIDDWTRVLTAFKTEMGAVAPLILSKAGYNGLGGFLSPYDVGPGFYPNADGEVVYGFAEPGFRAYLTQMNQWYMDGLIDPSFASTASNANFYAEYLTTGKAGAIDITYHDILPLYNSMLEGEQRMVAVGYPRMTPDQQLHVGQYEFRVAARKTGIRAEVENPELAIRWWDYVYSDEGSRVFNWGVEGETYELVDGKPRFLDKIVNNEEGLAYGVWGWKYKLFNGPYQFDMWAMPEEQVSLSVAAISTWAEGNDRAYNMPPVEYPEGLSDEYNNIMGEINTYKDQMILKFIMGVESIDGFDDYVQVLRDMGLDRALEIQSEALALYHAR